MDRAWRVRSGLTDLRLVRRWDWRGPEPAAARLTAWELEELPRTALLDICRTAFPLDPGAGEGAPTAELRERVRRGLDEGQLLLVDEAASRALLRPGPIGNFFKKLKAAVTGSRPAAPPAPPPPAQAPPAPAVQSGLGSDVDALVAKSPSATSRLTAFKAAGGTVEWGPSGGGSYYAARDKKIVIDQSQQGSAAAATQTLSHELGHARSPVRIDESSRQAYVDSYLADEGEATLANCEARSEISAAGGPDIGVAGQNAQRYQDIHDAHLQPGQRDEARQQIGQAFGNGEHPSTDPSKTYAEYYGSYYDQTHPPAAGGGPP